MTTTDELLDRIEELEQEQAQLQTQLAQTKEQYQQVTGLFEQFKTGKISRRAFLTSVTALAGVGFAAGNASAAPDYTNASGVAGTERQPLSSANIKQLNAQQIGSDTIRSDIYGDSADLNSVSADAIAFAREELTDVSGSREFNTEYQNTNATVRVVEVVLEIDGSSTAEDLNAILAVGNSSGLGPGQRADQAKLINYDNEYHTTVGAMVPPDGFYQVESFGDEVTVNWREGQLA
jgi:DNA-binding protein H-NS